MNKESTFSRAFFNELSFFMAIPALIWQVLFFCIPLFFIIMVSFFGPAGSTFEYYRNFFNPLYAKIIFRSLILAFFTATAAIFLAYPLAYHLVFYVKRLRNLLLFLLILPFWINILVQVYAWFFVLDTYGLINSLLLSLHLISQPIHLINTPFALAIVMLYCYFPFMVMPIYATLEKFDRRLLEASADLGATPWQTFTRITLPLSAPGILTGFFLVFIPSFGEFVIPALVGGGKQFYVGSLIAHYFLVMRDSSMGSAFTCLAACVLILAVALIYLFFKRVVMKGRIL